MVPCSRPPVRAASLGGAFPWKTFVCSFKSLRLQDDNEIFSGMMALTQRFQTPEGVNFLEAIGKFKQNEAHTLSVQEMDAALQCTKTFYQKHTPGIYKELRQLAEASSSLFSFAMNLADFSAATSSWKRWAAMVPADGYQGDALQAWQSDPTNSKVLASFFKEAFEAKRLYQTQSKRPKGKGNAQGYVSDDDEEHIQDNKAKKEKKQKEAQKDKKKKKKSSSETSSSSEKAKKKKRAKAK